MKNTPDIIADQQVRKVAKEVSDYLGVSVAEILGTSRKKEIVRGRRLVVYLAHETLDISLPRIAKVFGHESYSAEAKHCSNIEAWRSRYPMVREIVEDLSSRVNTIKRKNKLPLRFQKQA